MLLTMPMRSLYLELWNRRFPGYTFCNLGSYLSLLPGGFFFLVTLVSSWDDLVIFARVLADGPIAASICSVWVHPESTPVVVGADGGYCCALWLDVSQSQQLAVSSLLDGFDTWDRALVAKWFLECLSFPDQLLGPGFWYDHHDSVLGQCEHRFHDLSAFLDWVSDHTCDSEAETVVEPSKPIRRPFAELNVGRPVYPWDVLQ